MSLPDIDFEQIRPYDGSRHAGFEELCAQLASLKTPPTTKFVRKGRGADAGVECYQRQPDGTEVGWQAKYLFRWDASLTVQLDDSIRTALDKHLRLVEYIVCLPFDLPDSRTGRSMSAREKWDVWCAKWTNKALVDGRLLKITLWGKSELAGLLANDSAVCGGRILYWFNSEAFTSNWFVGQFEKTRADLGARYTPETNVELPIRQDILAFARDPALQKQMDEWFFRVTEEGCSAVKTIRKLVVTGSTKSHVGALAKAIDDLAASLDCGPVGPDQRYPLEAWRSAAKRCQDLARSALRWAYDLPTPKPGGSDNDPKRRAQHRLYKLMDLLSTIEDAMDSMHWQLANAPAMLLTGPAGIGKSHLLADVVESQTHEGHPALLVLGSKFNDSEPWRQILHQLDRPPTEQIKHFLGSMDAAAQAAGVRALICIDALNERNGLDVWPDWLTSFLKTVEFFPRIGVILSCRSTYVPYVIPDSLGDGQLLRVEHGGFAGDGGSAAKVYLDKRGIVRPGAPNLVPEFENPLFLKTCCDFLKKEGKNELPRGLRGVTSIFGFYNDAVTRALNRRMKLDPHFGIVPRAISGFAQWLSSAGEGYIRKSEAIALFESILPSGGSLDRSLLSQLESEGLLTIEPIQQNDGALVEMVRFTFERFSDHAIAAWILQNYLEKYDVVRSFRPDQPLYEFVFGPNDYRRAGIIEAMAVQIPELTNVEILDVVENTSFSGVVRHAFLESLLWREQTHFTDRTLKLARELLSLKELTNLLISISTEPANKFNAHYIHAQLIKMTMPQRDAFWSVYLAENGYEHQVETLISWALHNGQERIDGDRAHLAATMLVWFLTASHRQVRDKATKALACILSRRLSLAVVLLKDFETVNDPYVSERLLAACYGAALQGLDSSLSDLAKAVFDWVFADRKPPADALLRDHAHGIIAYARWCGALGKSVDPRLAQPPYTSPCPIEPVPDELIDSYTEMHEKGVSRDAIVGSTVNDGDFARYQMDHKVDKWSPAPLGTVSLPTPRDLCKAWLEEFEATASAGLVEAFGEFVSAAEGAKDIASHQKTDGNIRLSAADAALKAAMTSDQWENFRIRARDFIRHQLFGNHYTDRPATVNIAWCRRWVCKRTHELGWEANLFAAFDHHNGRYDRHDHKVERIGKKYQWIALRELLARMADNLAYVGDTWERKEGVPVYRGARQIGLRDIDPSLLVTATHYDGWTQSDRTWWVPFNPQLRAVRPLERRVWLESDNDIVNNASLIDLRNPKTGGRWLALSGFSCWTSSGVLDGRKELQRETWFRLSCIVVHRSDQAALVDGLRNQLLTDFSSLPQIELHGEFYLGEYPWHPDLEEFDDWRSLEQDERSTPVPTRATVARYACERGNYDYSIDRTISVEIPAPWLAKAMDLRLTSGRSPIYVDTSGRDIFYDPSVLDPGPAAALVDRDAFLQMLDREGLSAIWVIAGEKNVYGGPDAGLGFGGSFRHTAIYQVVGDVFSRDEHKDWVQPSKSQLAEFFREDPVSSGVTESESPESGTERQPTASRRGPTVKNGPKTSS